MKEYKNPKVLNEVYTKQGSLSKTAKYFGISKKLVLNHMKKFDIPRNKQPIAKPKVVKIDTFHKGYIITWNGYKRIMVKDHPFADSKGYVLEHRYIMEQHIGRYLNDFEVVHHKNGNKLDNTIENLELMTNKEHKRLHLKDSIHKLRYSLN